MDKRTLLAVVLSVVIISVGFFLQGVLFPQPKHATQATTAQAQPATQSAPTESSPAPNGTSASPALQTSSNPTVTSIEPSPADASGLEDTTYTVQTQVAHIVFTSRGAAIEKFELVKHLDQGQPLEMINSGTSGVTAFNIAFGGPDAPVTDALFHFRKVNDTTYEFSREFLAPATNGGPGVPFTLTKTYVIYPDSYMIEVKVGIQNSQNAYPNLDVDGHAYTLVFGPQIGPRFAKMGDRGEFRNYYTYADGKRKTVGVANKGEKTVDQHISWAAIVGKYFTVIGIPDATSYQTTFSSKPIQGIVDTSELMFTRPLIKSASVTDVFQFYLGPKSNGTLSKYNDAAKNEFGTSGLNLTAVVDRTPLLGWLEDILNFFLQLFYKLIPNWGVAIILLTVLIKLVLYPFTRKSYESTSKMQALAPKLNELREKYKNNPQKLNQEMAALYKREGVSPLGGCLPLLLQMPVLFALYGLLNTEFQLRGAVFIPGWITDLSQPESILHFSNFTVPLLGWSDLRLLPIIYVGSQLLSSKLMQTPDSSTNKNMLLLTYLMPVMFFFILYNVASGLILYWTVMNILTVAQQMWMNRSRQRKLGLVRK